MQSEIDRARIACASGGAAAAYVGRFAPSPTGPLHAGSLVAAMASYLDARAKRGQWLVRIEDIDQARTLPGAAEAILQVLACCGMHADSELVWQSRRDALYQAAFDSLGAQVFACGCSRREVADSNVQAVARGKIGNSNDRAATSGELVDPNDGAGMANLPLLADQAAGLQQVYPGTCRFGMQPGRSARAWRLRVPPAGTDDDLIGFEDRACGWQAQWLSRDVGDFVLRRADGFWAYQLAVVVDDADQGVTHVVRGMDLLDSTPRQIYLQRLLKLATPVYLHTPLVCNSAGEKLSKQTGAMALDLHNACRTLRNAAAVLGLALPDVDSVDAFWQRAIPAWAARYPVGPSFSD